uniref:Glutamine amidotransferase type-2 domain-containing protein n=1 Tax=Strongyloides venezuelensis TaxID=75913 RepID=A0A0K0FYV5_STRVS
MLLHNGAGIHGFTVHGAGILGFTDHGECVVMVGEDHFGVDGDLVDSGVEIAEIIQRYGMLTINNSLNFLTLHFL